MYNVVVNAMTSPQEISQIPARGVPGAPLTPDPAAMDPYHVLKVDENDSIETIKAAYHKLILQHHPDKAKGGDDNATNQFLIIQQAWKTICDIENDPSTYKTVNSDEVPFLELEMLDVGQQLRVWPCRCGEQFEVFAEDLRERINTFQCNGCSLYITVCEIPDSFFVEK